MTGRPATASTLLSGTQTAAVFVTFSVTDANDQAGITYRVQAPNDADFSVNAATTQGTRLVGLIYYSVFGLSQIHPRVGFQGPASIKQRGQSFFLIETIEQTRLSLNSRPTSSDRKPWERNDCVYTDGACV